MSNPSVKLTKANKKWININKEKIDVLLDNGYNMDTIWIIARYIGSCSHDNKKLCTTCGEIKSKNKKWLKEEFNSNECLTCYKKTLHMEREVKLCVNDLISTLEINELCQIEVISNF